MERYVAHANVDHYLRLLNGDLPHPDRRTITRLLVMEEDKLVADLQNLEFAEIRASSGRERVDRLKTLRDSFAVGTAERAQAESLLIVFENTQTMLDDFCHRLRRVISRGGL